MFHLQVEYKYDKESMNGCVIPVVDDKLTLLNMKNTEMASDVSIEMKWLEEDNKTSEFNVRRVVNKYFFVASLQVKYKEKYEKAKGHYVPVMDTPQILHAKAVRTLTSEVSFIQWNRTA